MGKSKSKPRWDEELKEPRADSKLKKLPKVAQDTLWDLLNPQDLTVPAFTLEALAVYVLEEFGFEVSLRGISEWRAWYSLKQRIEAAQERAMQAKLELAKDPAISPDDIDRIAQTIFMAEAVEGMSVKAYIQLAKLQLQKEKHALERDKLAAATRTKIEAGLEELAKMLKGNTKAAKIFADLKAELARK